MITESTKRKIEEVAFDRYPYVADPDNNIRNSHSRYQFQEGAEFGYQLAMEEMKRRLRSEPLITITSENKEPKP